MVATTEQKARLLDLTTGVLELVRDGKRNPEDVLRVFQIIKEDRKFAERLLGKSTAPALLETLGTVTVPATSDPFVVGTEFGAAVWLSDNFKKWFFGKTEDPQPESTLRYSQLLRRSIDGPIIAELGGEAATVTSLAYIAWLIRQQSKGEECVLLTNSRANIFYAYDVNGQLRAVYAGRDDDGWYMNTYSVSNSNAWDKGRRVFSRNS
jgi:hypothetical protein